MPDLVRSEVVQTAETVVVKVGTNVLSRADGQLDEHRIISLAEQIVRLRASGRRVVLVSSGAVGAGMGLLGLPQRPSDLPHLQAAASVGQAHLIHLYDRSFREHGLHAAQLLLTANDFKTRDRYLNVRNTLGTLTEFAVIPIINENDTVSIAEIKFGDNDQLAAMVSNLFDSSLLVILSNVDGFYDGEPDRPDSRVIPAIDGQDSRLDALVSDTRSSRGTGGMRSKLRAIRMATSVGENVILANGTSPRILDAVLAGEPVGTLFFAANQSLPAWKRWIGYTVAPLGRLTLDDGACRAITQRGKSLLSAGITEVDGEFKRGELVSLFDSEGRELARGLTNYSATETTVIRGHRTEEIGDLLGDMPYKEVIHRNNLVVTHRD